ncbi:MAG: hypothetical protein AB7N54_10755 [Alphaproteobacteria bacterium]
MTATDTPQSPRQTAPAQPVRGLLRYGVMLPLLAVVFVLAGGMAEIGRGGGAGWVPYGAGATGEGFLADAGAPLKQLRPQGESVVAGPSRRLFARDIVSGGALDTVPAILPATPVLPGVAVRTGPGRSDVASWRRLHPASSASPRGPPAFGPSGRTAA